MKRSIRIKALVLLILQITEIVIPTTSWALTGGPSQPEMESFEPITTDQMVDPFTGDFTYNLPLMVVPGPEGGYPINIAYHAGANLDEESSWVGLGWNINAGVIHRSLNGIPDDFSGDEEIRETSSIKPLETFGITGGLGADIEIFGAEFSPALGLTASAVVSMDNYRGISMTKNLGLNFTFASKNKSSEDKECEEVDEGNRIETNAKSKDTAKRRDFTVGTSFGSRQGMGELSYGLMVSRKEIDAHQRNILKQEDGKWSEKSQDLSILKKSRSAAISFNSVVSIQPGNNVWSTRNYRLTASFGPNVISTTGEFANISGFYSRSFVGDGGQDNRLRKSYGYMYSGEAARDSDHLMDFSFSNDIPITKNSKVIPVVVPGQDTYMITGHGIGGQFKAYQGSVGVFYENSTEASSVTSNTQPEIGAGPTSGQFGITQESGYGRARVGSIKGNASNLIESYKFGRNEGILSEKFYFKLVGETTYNENNWYTDPENAGPQKFNAGSSWEDATLRPSITSYAVPFSAGETQQDRRKTRNQFIGYKTGSEILVNDQFNQGDYVRSISSESEELSPVEYSDSRKIEEFCIKDEKGQAYYYNLPARNTLYREANFAVDDGYTRSSNGLYTTYQYQDLIGPNLNGADNFIYTKEVPAYAHSYLVTKILSPDYVDRTFDGPTEDDFGNYVKFGYQKLSNYKWRIPYEGASLSLNSLTDPLDDKGSYVYGEKELYYLAVIETKTHIAKFVLSPRSDARGAAAELSNTFSTDASSGQMSYKLNAIRLYRKDGENEILIQECEFKYDYSLCQGDIPNFVSLGGSEQNLYSGASNASPGKLTLKSIVFRYGEYSMEKEAPYVFEYYNTYGGVSTNLYDPSYIDKWGSYCKRPSEDPYQLHINPYMNPYYAREMRDEFAQLFNLKQITFPSGSKLEIQYEADDYAYVQGKKAMNMLQLAGVGEIGSYSFDNLIESSGSSAEVKQDDRRLYFILEKPVSSEGEGVAAVRECLKDENGTWMKDLHFKVYSRLKRSPASGSSSDKICDYVEGYAQIYALSDYSSEDVGNHYGFVEDESSPNYGFGYVDIEKYETVNDGIVPSTARNPLRVAALQYLRTNREDLLNAVDFTESGGFSLNTITSFLSGLIEMMPTIVGFYNRAVMLGWGKDISGGQPSFVRMYDSDNRKFGGGYRVKSILLKNNMFLSSSETSEEIIQTNYYYVNENGGSSGVAQNEPMSGGQENALNQPLFQGSNTYLGVEPVMAVSRPLMSAFYPAPQVGYSRVLVLRVPRVGTSPYSNEGITEHRFYTARDFPVKEDFNQNLEPKKFNITIPLVVVGGNLSFQNAALSQGFSVELNNMHGQVKSVKTYNIKLYHSGAENYHFDENFELVYSDFGPPVTSTEYHYYVNAQGQLENRVPVLLDQFGTTSYAYLGMDREVFMGERERSSWDVSLGLDMNLNATPLPVPSALPQGSYGEIFGRFLTVSSVQFKVGMLKEVVSSVNGITTRARNVLFDKMTGEVLVSESEVDGERPVTTMKIPAYWRYSSLGQAFVNYRASISNAHLAYEDQKFERLGTQLNLTDIFSPGDIVQLTTSGTVSNYWVTEVELDEVTLVDEFGDPPASVGGTFNLLVIESGRKNQQSLKSGEIVFSGRFSDIVSYSVLKELNEIFKERGSDAVSEGLINEEIAVCGFDLEYDLSPSLFKWTISMDEEVIEGSMDANLVQSGSLEVYEVLSGLPEGYYVQLERNPQGRFSYAFYNDQDERLTTPEGFSSDFYHWTFDIACMDGVLNASAFEFSDSVPMVVDYELQETLADNPYVSGQRGRWFPYRTYSYQVDRKQGIYNDLTQGLGTNAMADGTFNEFIAFIWGDGEPETYNEDNRWLKNSEITRVNQNMSPLEEINAIDIYAAEIFANDENLVLANAGNARYSEIAFMDFENVGSSFTGVFGNIYQNGISISSSESHTGKHSRIFSGTGTIVAELDGSSSASVDRFKSISGKEYVVSFWIKNTSDWPFIVKILDDSDNVITSLHSDDVEGKPIDGWQLISLTAPFDDDVIVKIEGGAELEGFVDDLRVQPMHSNMSAYVYDYSNYRVLATLDDRNYATLYNYSVDGALYQTKRETKNGIYTIKSHSQNVK